MKQPIRRILLLCCTCAAIFFFIAAYQFVLWRQFKNEYEKAMGIIVKNKIDKKRKFYPVIRFKTLDNQKVTFTATQLSSKMKYNEGDTISVYYDLLNADDVHIAGDEYRGLLIFGLLSMLFAFIGGYGFWYILQLNQERKELIFSGKILSAKVIGIKNDTILGGLIKTYQIVCEYENLSGEKQNYESQFFTQNPDNQFNNETIKVYLDKENPKIYFVDTSNFPKDSFLY